VEVVRPEVCLLANATDIRPVPNVYSQQNIEFVRGIVLALLGERHHERVAVVRIARQRLGMQDELAASGAGIGGDDRGLDADLWTTLALQAGL
jgi:hypothetical protein